MTDKFTLPPRTIKFQDEPEMTEELKIGDRVEKIKGYRWPGVIVAIFETTQGKLRYVVECTVPEVAGALHIYAPEQIVAIGHTYDC